MGLKYYRDEAAIKSRERTILLIHRDRRSGMTRNIMNIKDVVN